MNPQRVDIDGFPLRKKIHRSRCAECGMGLVSVREFHPWRACEVFKETHDSREVWRALYREGLVSGPNSGQRLLSLTGETTT